MMGETNGDEIVVCGNVLPIAFPIVGSKNFEYWEFFLSNLLRHVVRQDNVCLISDISKGLVTATGDVNAKDGVKTSKANDGHRLGLSPKSYAVDLRNRYCHGQAMASLGQSCVSIARSTSGRLQAFRHDPSVTGYKAFQERYWIVKPRLNDPGYFLDRKVLPYLDVTGLGVVAYIQTADLQVDLISTLVERWCPESHAL
ncbi:hypothetical protein PVK06_028384 [Gossypium arboreum]|uniref:Uncharacterized protein n=1 Tax=Gossypium arboreum TaxID=29729 RepID=A0ABR0P2W6_GOSAR|nr:hypothetical protein PVK06_028384 [Gossypium arboreum]